MSVTAAATPPPPATGALPPGFVRPGVQQEVRPVRPVRSLRPKPKAIALIFFWLLSPPQDGNCPEDLKRFIRMKYATRSYASPDLPWPPAAAAAAAAAAGASSSAAPQRLPPARTAVALGSPHSVAVGPETGSLRLQMGSAVSSKPAAAAPLSPPPPPVVPLPPHPLPQPPQSSHPIGAAASAAAGSAAGWANFDSLPLEPASPPSAAAPSTVALPPAPPSASGGCQPAPAAPVPNLLDLDLGGGGPPGQPRGGHAASGPLADLLDAFASPPGPDGLDGWSSLGGMAPAGLSLAPDPAAFGTFPALGSFDGFGGPSSSLGGLGGTHRSGASVAALGSTLRSAAGSVPPLAATAPALAFDHGLGLGFGVLVGSESSRAAVSAPPVSLPLLGAPQPSTNPAFFDLLTQARAVPARPSHGFGN